MPCRLQELGHVMPSDDEPEVSPRLALMQQADAARAAVQLTATAQPEVVSTKPLELVVYVYEVGAAFCRLLVTVAKCDNIIDNNAKRALSHRTWSRVR